MFIRYNILKCHAELIPVALARIASYLRSIRTARDFTISPNTGLEGLPRSFARKKLEVLARIRDLVLEEVVEDIKK